MNWEHISYFNNGPQEIAEDSSKKPQKKAPFGKGVPKAPFGRGVYKHRAGTAPKKKRWEVDPDIDTDDEATDQRRLQGERPFHPESKQRADFRSALAAKKQAVKKGDEHFRTMAFGKWLQSERGKQKTNKSYKQTARRARDPQEESTLLWQDRIYGRLAEGLVSGALGLGALAAGAYLGHKLGKEAKEANKAAADLKAKRAKKKEAATATAADTEKKGRWRTDVATGVDPLFKKELENRRKYPNPNTPKSQADIEASIERYKRRDK